jgi:hypothetical protein
MTDRAGPEMPQIPADSPKAAAPPDAETRFISETSAPMLDVHAPHESIHSWKGFFIHIAAIAFGLLLALALEKTAEYLHQRRLLSDARSELAAELENNRRAWLLIPRMPASVSSGWRAMSPWHAGPVEAGRKYFR